MRVKEICGYRFYLREGKVEAKDFLHIHDGSGETLIFMNRKKAEELLDFLLDYFNNPEEINPLKREIEE